MKNNSKISELDLIIGYKVWDTNREEPPSLPCLDCRHTYNFLDPTIEVAKVHSLVYGFKYERYWEVGVERKLRSLFVHREPSLNMQRKGFICKGWKPSLQQNQRWRRRRISIWRQGVETKPSTKLTTENDKGFRGKVWKPTFQQNQRRRRRRTSVWHMGFGEGIQKTKK